MKAKEKAIYASALAAKIACVNQVNAEVLRLERELRAAFAPYVGQKIEKADGQLLAKLAHLAPVSTFQTWKDSSDYALRWIVNGCTSYQRESERGTDYCSAMYYDQGVFVGHVRNGVLVDVATEPTTLRTDYTEAEVHAARAAYAEAEQAMRAARDKMHPFGEYDL